MPCSIFLDFKGLTPQIFNLECAVLSRSDMSDSLRPCGLQPARLLCPWGFSRQESWSGLPCPPPGDLPHPGTEPRTPALQVDALPSEPPGKPLVAPKSHDTCPYKRHMGEIRQTRESDVKTETEIRMSNHKPRNANSHEKLEETRNKFSLRFLRVIMALQTP